VPLPDLLERLLTAPGPSGHEARATAVWREAAEAFAEVTVDPVGTAYARVAGRGEGPTVALVGHVDQIGVIVTHVESSGLLAFAFVGGIRADVMNGQRVLLLGRGGDVPGVIARSAVAAAEVPDRGPTKLSELHIDVGARDGDEARALVRPGDVGVFVGAPLELANARFAAGAMDNRIGAYVVLEAARRIAEAGRAPGDVVAVAATQEETLHAGAKAAAHSLDPDVAIAVDITPCSDVPGGDPRRGGEVRLGGGPALDLAPAMNRALNDVLAETAEREGIALQYEVSTRLTMTDADEFHSSGPGRPTALVSVPLRYTHSPVETAQLSDVEDAIRLIVATVLRLDSGVSLAR
jgi:endoglucanase